MISPLIRHVLRCLFVLCVTTATAASMAQDAGHAWPGRVEAVRGGWDAQAPPATGWADVALPDDWSTRWPAFDGVVWYRLTWTAPAPVADTGLFVEYLIMAGAIRINGTEIARDTSLVEPLTRTWNMPRYFLLAAPLLQAGDNTLLIRVSGLAAYQPGLGPVRIGAPAAMQAAYERERWQRRDLNLYSTALCATLGCFFLVLWLLRRQEVAYGWYGAQQLLWVGVAWNQITTSVWPFATTDAFQAFNTMALVVYMACYAMFVLRFCDLRWPRREALLWAMALAGCGWLLLAPHTGMRLARDALTLWALGVYLLINVVFVHVAWRHGRTDQRALALVALLMLVAAVHDGLTFVRVIPGNDYYATATVQLSVIGVAVVLAWNFVRNLRRIEGFNTELQHNVAAARAELASTLARQHELELVHARLGERVSLAHDLHDGLGGMLIGNIAALEQAPSHLPSHQVLGMFRELRDDLRLIIDTAAAQQYGEHSLADLLAPLRHRTTRLFEPHGIDVRWRVENLDRVYLSTTRSLDLLRVAQEALANVLKHAGARLVNIELVHADAALRLAISDDGVGLSADDEDAPGTGMRSMQARARRLGATLSVASEPGATVVRLRMPWALDEGQADLNAHPRKMDQ